MTHEFGAELSQEVCDKMRTNLGELKELLEAEYGDVVSHLQSQDIPITPEQEAAADEINRRYP